MKRKEARIARANEAGNEAPEVELYEPRFFTRQKSDGEDGNPKYTYTPIEGKYWNQRETGEWPDSPHIYSDDCVEF